MRKENKGVVVEQLKGFLSEYPHFYLTNIEGLDAAKTAQLRRACNKGGIKLVVAKNTLLRKALSESDVDFATLYSALKGNTAIMFTTVANAPAKIIKDFARIRRKSLSFASRLLMLRQASTELISSQSSSLSRARKSSSQTSSLCSSLPSAISSPPWRTRMQTRMQQSLMPLQSKAPIVNKNNNKRNNQSTWQISKQLPNSL